MGRRHLPIALLIIVGLRAVCCWAQEPTQAPATAPEPDGSYGEVIPVPDPLGGEMVLHEHGDGVVESCCPEGRTIHVNLSVERPSHLSTTQLKTKSGEVLAESVEVPEERLEFEVLLSAPCGEIPVYFAIPESSPLHAVYYRYRDRDPEKILSFMDTVRPPVVRVLALREERLVPYYAGTRLQTKLSKEPWRVFYEVCLPDSACPEPVLVPILENDDYLHDLMYRAVARVPFDQDIVLIRQLSGELCANCCTVCGRTSRPCGPHCAPEKCYCGGKNTFGYGRQTPITPSWGANRCRRCCPICNYSPGLCRAHHIQASSCACGGQASFLHLNSQYGFNQHACYPLRIVCNRGCLPGECHCFEPHSQPLPPVVPPAPVVPSLPTNPAWPNTIR